MKGEWKKERKEKRLKESNEGKQEKRMDVKKEGRQREGLVSRLNYGLFKAGRIHALYFIQITRRHC